jgi:hypothetical protein|tara:strand:+ start:22298 stop:22444 length:147 start_codon:yes stop_codon:yes gene_type:complete
MTKLRNHPYNSLTYSNCIVLEKRQLLNELSVYNQILLEYAINQSKKYD